MVIEELPEFLLDQHKTMNLTEYQELRNRLLDGPMVGQMCSVTGLREIKMRFKKKHSIKTVLVSYEYYPTKELIVLISAEHQENQKEQREHVEEPVYVAIPSKPQSSKPKGHAKP